MLIDAHCHLEKKYYDDVDAVIQRALDAGVQTMVAIGASGVLDGAHEAIELAQRRDEVKASIGIHPHEAEKATPDHLSELETLLEHPEVVSLGEFGLDYYYDNSPRQAQKELFRSLLELAHKSGKPIMLHLRDAHADALAILDEVGMPEAGGVIHCFSAGPQEAEDYLDRGFYLSIPGIVTFKKAQALQEAVRNTPLDRMFVETDAPYLAPIPYRGKPNEPAYVVQTAEKVAELKGCSLAEVAEATTHNSQLFFGLS